MGVYEGICALLWKAPRKGRVMTMTSCVVWLWSQASRSDISVPGQLSDFSRVHDLYFFLFSQLLSCWHSCHTQFFKNFSTGPLPVLFPGWFNKPDSLPFLLCPLLDMDPGKHLSSRPSLDFGSPSLSLSLCQSESSPLFYCCWIPPCLMPYYLPPEITLSFCWNTSYSSILKKNAFSKCFHVWTCLYSTPVLDW